MCPVFHDFFLSYSNTFQYDEWVSRFSVSPSNMRSGFQDLESWKEFSLMRDSLIRNSSRTLISDFLPSDDENIDMEDEFPVEWFETDSIDDDWIVKAKKAISRSDE